MKHIIRALVLIIILYIAAEHYRYSAGISNLINVGFLIAFLYLIAAVIGIISRLIVVSRNKTIPPVENTPAKKWGCSWLLLVLIMAVIIYFFREELGNFSHKTFLFSDNLAKLTSTVSPVISWALLGLLAGSLYGSFVAWKKYKLNATVNLVPVGVIILIFTILFLVNTPSASDALDDVTNTQTTYAYGLVTAETALPDNNAMYKPSFLLDSSDKTAWITNAGKGNTDIRFSFKGLANYANKDLHCVGFLIINGYRKSPQLWNNFARAKEIAIRHNGKLITSVIVNDNNSDSEEIKINPVPLSSFDNISVSINTVYPGEKYPNRVAVSELVPVVQYRKF